MPSKTQQWTNQPEVEIDLKKEYHAQIKTDKGSMKFELFTKEAPTTVNNFVFLSRQGFYDNTIFHRVIANFMAQAGDPTGTGRGGPGYRFKDEFHPNLRHDKPGMLSMANSGSNTNGSQFFITHVATPWLDNKHSIFGELIEGEEVLFSIPERDPQNPNQPGVHINTITILET